MGFARAGIAIARTASGAASNEREPVAKVFMRTSGNGSATSYRFEGGRIKRRDEASQDL